MPMQNFYHQRSGSEYTHTESEMSAEEIQQRTGTERHYKEDDYGVESADDDLARDKNLDIQAQQVKLQSQSINVSEKASEPLP